MSDTDLELLARYTRQHAEDAFAEILRRHLGLVYSAAVRQVRSPQLAEEVAQSVFTDLARSAAKLKASTILTAWLYQVTRRTAIDVVRREASRQLREQIATEMNAMNATAADWTHIEPLLDEAMHALDDTDRTAVLLRYFENKSLREVGATLGTSENAAQKRLARAVERLREFFAKRGVTVGASGLVVVISANAVQAAPVGLTVPLIIAAKAAGAANVNSSAISTVLNWLTWTKAKTAMAAASVLLFVGAVAVYDSEAPNTASGKSRLPVGPGLPSICMGGGHGLILASDGSLWSWGENYLGWPVLGLGTTESQSALRRIGHESDWVDVSSSFTHCLALKFDGSVWGWGENLYGQLGLGTSGRQDSDRSQPVRVPIGNDWKQVAAGGSHSLALKTNGTLWAWGSNWAGQLGTGDSAKEIPEITQIGIGTNWIKIWAAGLQSVGQQSDGSLWFWGSLTGSANDTNRFNVPTRISADTNWSEVGFGYFTVFAIKHEGTLWVFGRNAGIYTGGPVQLVNPSPARIGTNSDWKAISHSENFYQILEKTDGSLWALDASGAFINETSYKTVELRPINLKKDVVAFGAAGRGIMGVALTRNGEVWTWGKALGEYTSGNPVLQSVADAIKWKTDRFQPKPVMRDKPWLLPIEE